MYRCRTRSRSSRRSWLRRRSRSDCSAFLHFKRADIDSTITHAPEIGIALIVPWWRNQGRITRVHSRATGQECTRKSRSTVVLQRTQQRVGVNLITWTVKIAPAEIAADVVTVRGCCAAEVSRVLSVVIAENAVFDYQHGLVGDASADSVIAGRYVMANGTVTDPPNPSPIIIYAAPKTFGSFKIAAGSVIADGTVRDR